MRLLFTIVLLAATLFAHNDLKKISLQLKWKYQFQFAGFIVAKEKGFYKELGLDMRLLEFDSSKNMMEDLKKGLIDFAVNDSSLILEAMKGAQVRAIMAIFQHSPYLLMGLKSSKIKSIKDVEGKRIALHDDISGVTIKAMLKSNGVRYLTAPLVYTLEKLSNKEVDFVTAYASNEPFVAKEQGIEVVTFNPRDYGFDAYGDILFSSKKMIENNPELVKKVKAATIKGWDYAFTHVNETVDLIHKSYNTLNKSKKALLYEAEVLKDLSGYGKNFGEIHDEKIKSISQIFSFMMQGKYTLSALDNFVYRPQSIENILSAEEKSYIKEQASPTYLGRYGWLPFEGIDERGHHVGMVSEHLSYLEKSLGITFRKVMVERIHETLAYEDSREIDVLLGDMTDEMLKEKFLPIDSFIQTPIVIVMKKGHKYVDDLDEIVTKNIAIMREARCMPQIYKRYPKIAFTEVADRKEGFLGVATGKYDAMISSLALASYTLDQMDLDTLAIVGKTDVSMELTLFVNKDKPMLHDIINKTMHTMKDEEHERILKNWQHISNITVDYGFLWELVSITLIVLLFLLYRQKILKKYTHQLEKQKALLDRQVDEQIKQLRNKDQLLIEQAHFAQLGEMMNMIAHQWRQPLNSISASTIELSLLNEFGRLDQETVSQTSKFIQDRTQELSEVINDFMNFNKVLDDAEVSLSESATGVLKIIQSQFVTKGIKIEVDIDKECTVYHNQKSIDHALINILINARDAFEEHPEIKEKIIKIYTQGTEERIDLIIEDNAGGISDDVIKKVFNPYFTTKKEGKGMGIGLYLVKQLIEKIKQSSIAIKVEDGHTFFIISMRRMG